MKFRAVLVLAATCLAGCGDVVSTEPLVGRGDAIYDAALLGTWFDQDNSVFTVTSPKPPEYDILYVVADKGERYWIKGRLMQMGELKVLDVTDDRTGPFSLPVHAWASLERKGNGWEIRFLDSNWFQNKVRMSQHPYFIVDNSPVLTASTARLQELVRESGLSPEARSEAMVLLPFRKPSGQ